MYKRQNYYNPNWGYQAGKKRNARVRNNHEPVVMLHYTYDITERSQLNGATSIRFGKNGYSALTWFDGAEMCIRDRVSSPWPYPDQYTDYTKKGSGAATVGYSGQGSSIRNSGLSDGESLSEGFYLEVSCWP